MLLLSIPVIVHSIEFEILICIMLKIAFPGLEISKFSVGHAPRPRLRRSYLITPLNKYCCQYERPFKNLSYGPGIDEFIMLQGQNCVLFDHHFKVKLCLVRRVLEWVTHLKHDLFLVFLFEPERGG